jgi:hypothetical protein
MFRSAFLIGWLAGFSLMMGELAVADPVASLEVVQGQLGQFEGRAVGVAWVAPDGSSAQIMVAGGTSPSWEILFDVHPDDVVPLGAKLIRIAAIAAPQGAKQGAVTLAPRTDSASPDAAAMPDVIMLPAGGRLRLDGPSVMTATDLTVVAWLPDEHAPKSVTAEWLPARFAKEATPKEEIVRQDLTVGSSATVGHNRLTVAAIQAASDRHPAWLVMRIARL